MLRVVLRRVVLSTALLACTALPPKQPLAGHLFLSCHPLPLAEGHALCSASIESSSALAPPRRNALRMVLWLSAAVLWLSAAVPPPPPG